MKDSISRLRKAWLVVLIVFLSSSSSLFCQGLGWALVKAKVHHDFPDVSRIDTRALANWLEDSKREAPLLLDVRSQVEFEVSHLANAKRIEPGSDPAKLDVPKSKPIVTYCSVGYRSSAFAAKLKEAGFKNVFNLDGSIFQWANEGRLMVRDSHPTGKVHPFNSLWGTLLEESRRAKNAAPTR